MKIIDTGESLFFNILFNNEKGILVDKRLIFSCWTFWYG